MPETSEKHTLSGRVDVLDGVRVICVFFVAWFHIWQQSWLTPSFTVGSLRISLDFITRSGYIFVDGLILLSGFLLFLPYARYKWEGGKRPGGRDFYIRRVIRIVPSYYFCILALLLFEAIPQGKYNSLGALLQDVFMHATFTHTLTAQTYLHTPLNGALWTLGVEAQAYLIFPFLAWAFLKKPAITYLLMTGAAFLYRGLVQQYTEESTLFFNQLPAFLDVYANGMLASFLYAALKKRKFTQGMPAKIVAAALALGAAYAVTLLMKNQASQSGQEAIRICQMNQRYLLTAALAAVMLGLTFTFSGVRFLFGNRVMAFLSGISFNFYIWHQLLSVWLKNWNIPLHKAPYPNMAGEQPWQTQYTFVCFFGAILVAAALTYGLEKLGAKLIAKAFRRGEKTYERPADGAISA